jgi:glycosyltransferase involved in cell wall biosynthesis
MKFCFYGNIYTSLIGEPTGGSELQTALLAKTLSEHGHEVIVIDNHFDNTPQQINNINLLSTTFLGWKKIRFFTQKLPNSIRHCFKQKADYFYVRGINYMYIIPLLAAKKNKAKFIIGIPHDKDTLNFLERLKYLYTSKISITSWILRDLPSHLIYNILLKKADLILVQHTGQMRELKKRKIESKIFSNIASNYQNKRKNERNSYMYVGSLNERKGINQLVELFQILNNVTFKVIGSFQSRSDEKKYNYFKAFPNVIFWGQQNKEVVLEELSKAKILINTSGFEGFPNTFLEAWSVGTPVISLNVDPEGVIEKNNLGFYCKGDINKMIDIIRSNNYSFNQADLINYVKVNHSMDSAGERFMNILEGEKV